MELKDPITAAQCEVAVNEARNQGFMGGHDAAVDRNKSKAYFIRGIPVGIVIGAIVLLAAQKFLFGMF